MDITSVSYYIFVGISLLIYWKVPVKLQWIILLADSLIFYFLNAVPYTFIYLLISVISVYWATKYFDENPEGSKKIVLVVALIINFGLLAVLKYSNLAIVTFGFISGRSVTLVKWTAALGISFYTLQIVAYMLNCYWGVINREKNIAKLLLFTSFFPLMISGPISDYQVLGHQLFEEHRFDYDRVTSGLRRAAWGVAKKVVVADRLSIPINYMFDNPDIYSGIWVIAAAIGFCIVLYFDFSGCMDIIIGVSKCFGIILEENFKAPFLSKTIQEFWQRWHITLGGWLKSFVMYPILKTDSFVSMASGCKKTFGKQGKKIPTYIAMLAVWFLMGLWHGSSWKYIVGEGLWFWFVIVLGQILEPAFKKSKMKLNINDDSLGWKGFQVLRTMLLYSLGMIFFNAASFKAGLYMLSRIVHPAGIHTPLIVLFNNCWASFGGIMAFVPVIIVAILQIICDFFVYGESNVQERITKIPFIIRWILYFTLIFIIIIGGNFGKSSFIYFGF